MASTFTRVRPAHVLDDKRRPGWRRVLRGTSTHTVLILASLLTLFPVLLLISTATKTSHDVKTNPFGLFSSFSWENLVTAWTVGRFSDYLLDSILLSVPSTILVLICSTLGGYTFARLRFPGRTAAFYVLMLGLLVPGFTYMIPLYFQLRTLGLLDTLTGAILVLTTGSLAFGTFFMRAFFIELPLELEQAARIDGCSEFQIFWRIMLPLARSGVAALAVFMFLQMWNNFLVPLLYLPQGKYRPLTAGLYMFTGGRTTDIGPLAAGALITILPVVVLFLTLQRQVTQGFISGAVKG